MDAKLNIWLEQDGEVVLSLWRVQLLEAVDRTGSINAAAAEMEVHFRTAWEKIKQMEARLGMPLVESQTGGVGGGGTALTPEARRLLTRFHSLTEGLDALLDERFQALFASNAG